MSGSLEGIGDLLGEAAGKLFPLNLSFEFSKTEVGTLLLDVLLSEEIGFEGKVTRYPVEDGSEMSDHIIALSKTLKISGTCSNAEAYSFNLSSKKAKLHGVLETLEMIHDESKVITVTTALAVYNNMGIENLRATRSNNAPRDGNWIDITAELRHIRKVSLRRANVEAAAPASGRTGTTAARTTANATTAAGNTAGAAASSTPPAGTLANQLYDRASGYVRNYFGGSP